MADERRGRPAEALAALRRLRPRTRPRGEADSPAARPPAAGLPRRALFGAVAAGAIAALGYEVWPSPSSGLPTPPGQLVGPEFLAATLKKQAAPTKTMPSPGQLWSVCSGAGGTQGMTDLDLVLTIDTTGSMGAVLSDIKYNLAQLASTLRAFGPGVRVGVVAYRDLCDREVVRALPLQSLDEAGYAAVRTFIASLTAGGGCDWPEKMDAALLAATSMAWRGGVPASIVVIADAPVHPPDEAAALATARAFRDNLPGALVSLVDTGSGGHPFMPAVAKSGGGQYVTYDGHILKSLFPAISGCSQA